MGPRLSFLHMTSPTQDEQNVFASLNEDPNGIRESLQLLLDDESSVEDIDTRRSQSAFRPRVMLQPKSINQCHSDPIYPYMTPQVHNFSAVTQSRPPRGIQQDGDQETLSDKPALHHLSTESSTVTSPEDQGPVLFLSQDYESSAANSDNSRRYSTSLLSRQQQDDVDTDDAEVAHATTSAPLLPTMETPELVRPIRRGIILAPNPRNGKLLVQGISSPPRILGCSHPENNQESP